MSVTYSGNGADVEIGVTCCFTMSVNVHVSFHDFLDTNRLSLDANSHMCNGYLN